MSLISLGLTKTQAQPETDTQIQIPTSQGCQSQKEYLTLLARTAIQQLPSNIPVPSFLIEKQVLGKLAEMSDEEINKIVNTLLEIADQFDYLRHDLNKGA